MGLADVNKVETIQGYLFLNPKGRLVRGYLHLLAADCWESVHTQKEWAKLQREGWRIVKVNCSTMMCQGKIAYYFD